VKPLAAHEDRAAEVVASVNAAAVPGIDAALAADAPLPRVIVSNTRWTSVATLRRLVDAIAARASRCRSAGVSYGESASGATAPPMDCCTTTTASTRSFNSSAAVTRRADGGSSPKDFLCGVRLWLVGCSGSTAPMRTPAPGAYSSQRTAVPRSFPFYRDAPAAIAKAGGFGSHAAQTVPLCDTPCVVGLYGIADSLQDGALIESTRGRVVRPDDDG